MFWVFIYYLTFLTTFYYLVSKKILGFFVLLAIVVHPVLLLYINIRSNCLSDKALLKLLKSLNLYLTFLTALTRFQKLYNSIFFFFRFLVLCCPIT